MKLFKKAVATVLAAVLALSMLTACGGGGSSAPSTPAFSPMLAQKVNNKLSAMNLTVVLTNDEALVSKAQVIASKMQFTAAEIEGKDEDALMMYLNKKIGEAQAQANIAEDEMAGYFVGASEDAVAEQITAFVSAAPANSNFPVGAAKTEVNGLIFVWAVMREPTIG